MRKSARGSFFTPGGKPGVSFSSALTAAAILAGQGGDIYEFREEHHARRKKQVRVRTSPETQQLVKEMCPLDNRCLFFKLAVEQDMVINVLATRMEIPDEQLKVLQGRCVQDVKKTSGSISLDDAIRYQRGGL